MLKYLLLVNKQGQTRLSQYFELTPMAERMAIEAEVIRKCLARNEAQCSIMEYQNYKLVYRRYASLFFIVGADHEEVLCFLSFFFSSFFSFCTFSPSQWRNVFWCVL